jgi:hypothetical protein
VPYKNSEDTKKYMRVYGRAYVRKYKALAYEILGNKCVCCGETQQIFLSLDHIQNDGYIDRIKHGRRTTYQYKEIIENPDQKKYQLLCMNCNWAKRYGICPHKMES